MVRRHDHHVRSAKRSATPIRAARLAQTGPGLGAGGTVAPPGTNKASASGISPNAANNTTGTPVVPVPLPTAARAPTTGLLPALGFPNAGQFLLDHGVDLHGLAFDHYLANPSAGLVPGHDYNLAALTPAVDFDLQRILGLPGGTLHTAVTFFGLRFNIPGIAFQTGGEIDGLQTTPVTYSVKTALSLLTYEQKLLDDRLSIQAGRTNPFLYFELTNSLDPGAYFSGVFDSVADISSPRLPVWGGVANYHLTPAFAVQTAVFEDNFRKASLDPNSFGIDGASGVQIFNSLEYRTEFSTAAYPANAELGLEWNTRNGPSNVKGTAAPYNGRDAAADYGGGGLLFGQGQKVVWRSDAEPGIPPSNVALYGQFNVALDKPQPFDFDVTAGVNFTGFIPGRPLDAVGLQARYQRMSEIEANYETRVQTIFAGRGPSQSRNAFSYEIVGNIQATPWLQIRPFAEAFVNPDAYFNNGQPGRPHDGFEVGVYGIVPLGRLLGTSPKPF